jgi:hypothetical protein
VEKKCSDGWCLRTGSYPQLIHQSPYNATGGTITCMEFVDVTVPDMKAGYLPSNFGLTEQSNLLEKGLIQNRTFRKGVYQKLGLEGLVSQTF